MISNRVFIFAAILLAGGCAADQEQIKTEITKWHDGKKAAVSLTFDDGTRNQFSVAMPMLDELKMPATFYIITGEVEGSSYEGKYLGRPIAEVIKGTADTPTNKDNFFERASAIGFSGYKGALAFHTDAGTLFEGGKTEAAYRLIDSGYNLIRSGRLPRTSDKGGSKHLTWAAIKEYAAKGHEFGSHTVTHPRLAVLTEPNILYELEKSKEDIANNLGEAYTFSAECPYGTEDERVMEYAYKVYPSLRNRMPEKYLAELNRGSKEAPGSRNEEYVQWQRGAVTKTPLPMIKSWVDTVLTHDNNWLVLVFHGVDGIGWEALPGSMLKEYFEYMKQREDSLWIATFADVTKYMRERMNADVKTSDENGTIKVELTHSLDDKMYNLPLTLRTYVPADWQQAEVNQSGKPVSIPVMKDDKGSFVQYQMLPNRNSATIRKV